MVEFKNKWPILAIFALGIICITLAIIVFKSHSEIESLNKEYNDSKLREQELYHSLDELSIDLEVKKAELLNLKQTNDSLLTRKTDVQQYHGKEIALSYSITNAMRLKLLNERYFGTR